MKACFNEKRMNATGLAAHITSPTHTLTCA